MIEFEEQIYNELLEASFATAIAGSTAGIVISNPNLPDNPIVYANAAFEKITGYEKKQKSLAEIVAFCRDRTQARTLSRP